MKIQSVEPKDIEYDAVARAVNRRPRNKIDYDTLEKRYNALEVSGFLLVEVDKSLKVGNVAVVMNNRGLVRSTDYEIAKLRVNAKGQRIATDSRPLVITKLTQRPMTST